jgi:hypothetical protein
MTMDDPMLKLCTCEAIMGGSKTLSQIAAYEELRQEVMRLVNEPRKQRFGKRSGALVRFDELQRLRELVWKVDDDK